jgi:hypothetical protein
MSRSSFRRRSPVRDWICTSTLRRGLRGARWRADLHGGMSSFELAGNRRHYPKTSSIPSAACLTMYWYPVRVAVKNHGYAGAPKQVVD